MCWMEINDYIKKFGLFINQNYSNIDKYDDYLILRIQTNVHQWPLLKKDVADFRDINLKKKADLVTKINFQRI